MDFFVNHSKMGNDATNFRTIYSFLVARFNVLLFALMCFIGEAWVYVYSNVGKVPSLIFASSEKENLVSGHDSTKQVKNIPKNTAKEFCYLIAYLD